MSRVFFITPDINSPTGGIKQLYRQVDVLNDNGYEAFILHKKNGFRCTWFDNNTKVLYHHNSLDKIEKFLKKEDKKNSISKRLSNLKKAIRNCFNVKDLIKEKYEEVVFDKEDIIVFPEVYGKAIGKFFLENKKVVYNQNCYYTFWGYEFSNQSNPYLNNDIKAIIVASEDAINYMSFGFPNVPLYRVKYGINEKVFSYSENKKKQIAFMPRKLNEDIVQIINLLNFRNKLKGWTYKVIDKMDESQVSDALKESAFFLSLNHKEGFGMPPAEAMACGCIVVGYTGKGGKEFFKNDFCYTIEDRDIIAFAKTIENLALEYEEDNQSFVEKGKKASEFILSEYSMEMEVKTILDSWNSIIN
ncbi:intein [Flavobacterium cutihirudinis]|uniref:Intein n=1 Tax=Flavobacterium cutihirudinis TaxID=1265740 RepID=A0A3D9FK68_9FLAO|nr:glycosyltransferase [Flavobacterium cutihirudinis]RED19580.1 intein [Flavobacterium cutihirudinis]